MTSSNGPIRYTRDKSAAERYGSIGLNGYRFGHCIVLFEHTRLRRTEVRNSILSVPFRVFSPGRFLVIVPVRRGVQADPELEIPTLRRLQ